MNTWRDRIVCRIINLALRFATPDCRSAILIHLDSRRLATAKLLTRICDELGVDLKD